MADTGLFAWLCRASICGDADVERAAEIMKDYYLGVGPEPEYQERELMSPNEASALLDSFAVATPPSPSTAPEVDERAAFEAWASDPIRAEKLQLDRWPTNDGYKDTRTYIAFYGWKSGRAALASRPAEVDDEGLPDLPEPDFQCGDCSVGESGYTAEQYRQGQRDAVAAAQRDAK